MKVNKNSPAANETRENKCVQEMAGGKNERSGRAKGEIDDLNGGTTLELRTP
jgi:hypothetical protein